MELTVDASLVGLILAFIVHLGGSVWWASGVTARIKHVEDDMVKVKEDVDHQKQMNTEIAVMNTEIIAIKNAMNRIENILLEKQRSQRSGRS